MSSKYSELEHLIEIQGMDGTWDFSPYMRGLYNGLILAHNVVTQDDEAPAYRDAPEGGYHCARTAHDFDSEPEEEPAHE